MAAKRAQNQLGRGTVSRRCLERGATELWRKERGEKGGNIERRKERGGNSFSMANELKELRG